MVRADEYFVAFQQMLDFKQWLQDVKGLPIGNLWDEFANAYFVQITPIDNKTSKS